MRWYIGEVAWMYMWMDEWCQFRQRCLNPEDGYFEHVGRNFLFQPLCIYLFDRTINYPAWGQLPQGGNPGPFWGLKLNLQLNGVSPRPWKGLEHPEFSRFSFSFFTFQFFLVDSLIACALKTTMSGKIWHSVIFSKKYYPIVTERNLRLCRFFEKIFSHSKWIKPET